MSCRGGCIENWTPVRIKLQAQLKEKGRFPKLSSHKQNALFSSCRTQRGLEKAHAEMTQASWVVRSSPVNSPILRGTWGLCSPRPAPWNKHSLQICCTEIAFWGEERDREEAFKDQNVCPQAIYRPVRQERGIQTTPV